MGTNSDCFEQKFIFSNTVQLTGLQRGPGTQETQVWGSTARNNGNRNSIYSLECLNPREGLGYCKPDRRVVSRHPGEGGKGCGTEALTGSAPLQMWEGLSDEESGTLPGTYT